MSLTGTPTALADVLLIEPDVFIDERGHFFESFNARDFAQATSLSRGFVQDNHSSSRKGVLRGIHYQVVKPQGKLVRVVEGAVFDVAVDLRRHSPTLGQWVGVCLSSENKRQLWIPEGFGHGFLATTDRAQVLYKTTEYWHPEYDRSLLWCDQDIGIEWPLDGAPQLAPKDADAAALRLAELI